MAKIIDGRKRGRPGRWLVDWTDALGRRRITTCADLEEAKHRLAQAQAERGLRRECGLDPCMTVAELCDLWKSLRGPLLREQSRDIYEMRIRVHVLPALGTMKVANLSPLVIERWAAALLRDHKPATVAIEVAVLRMVLALAVRHGLLVANPCAGLVRGMGIRAGREKVKALTTEQLGALLAAAREIGTEAYEKVAILADTACRAGEALGLQWEDLDFEAKRLTVRRQVTRDHGVQPCKTREGAGTIDLPAGLVELLRERRARQRAEAFAAGRPPSPWVMLSREPTGQEGRHEHASLYALVVRCMEHAGLSGFGPHSLRHTYVSRMLAANLPPAWVQKQARHASIRTTVDVYGSWLQHDRPAGIDGLGAAVSR